MRRLFVFISFTMILLTLTFATPQPAQACSGGGPSTLPRLIDDADYIVEGEIVEVDDAAQNAVLRVEQYLYGHPQSENILLSLYSPSGILFQQIRDSGGGCFHGINPPLHLNDNIIIFLNRNLDGTYTLSTRGDNPTHYIFNDEDDVVPVFDDPVLLNSGGVSVKGRSVNRDTFIELIEEYVGHAPHAPRENRVYPNAAPLLVTTTDGTEWLIPVDGSPALAQTARSSQILRRNTVCLSNPCIGISPNGLDSLNMQDGIILSTHIRQAGRGFMISSTSNTFIVWVENRLELFVFADRLYMDMEDYLTPANSVILHGSDTALESLTGQAVWSANGQMLAYCDEQGVWLWDVFTIGSAPRLLAPATEDARPYARYFSPMGRYLNLFNGQENLNLDLVSGAILPDGVISPDERTLLAYDTLGEIPDAYTYSLTPYVPNQGWLVTRDSYIRQAEWISDYFFTYISCEKGNPRHCFIRDSRPAGLGSERSTFDYLDHIGFVSVSNDHTTIYTPHWTRDLSDEIHGRIASVEWLPSRFYFED